MKSYPEYAARPAQLKRITLAIQSGVEALQRSQLPNGAFPFSQRQSDGSWQACNPIFSTVTVLLCIGKLLPGSDVQRAIDYVVTCRESDGLWDYDPGMDIPADSDTVACALAALSNYAPDLIEQSDSDLLLSVLRPDGVFLTWYSDEDRWQLQARDDAVVNCNVIYALSMMGCHVTDHTIEAIAKLIQRSTTGSRYYTQRCMLAYVAVRAGFDLTEIPEELTTQAMFEDSPLSVAQSICAGIPPNEEAIPILLDTQCADGLWPAQPWCTGEGLEPWGSNAVTTAFCLEALNLLVTTPNSTHDD
ncbi:hypothetical protein BOW50_03550 [Solemya velum gill symbiont]|uniref:prenyltransferase/squalene oxidase repeat-containing protein n=1 Tax=Solemya velum gill symbiont TaxID=2340 RepID=UPI0009973E14|nr:prenyltransferase/squalene oxidase repeat-containing protein [Solemya velum gill symbiont]OOZ79714.1 hypothetical protein BOW50_03550 [Solemya velum gill symbiont]